MQRIISVIFGNVLMGVVVGIMSFMKVGTDVFTGMNLGISDKIGMSLGYEELIVNGLLLIFVIVTARKYIGFGTIVNMVIIGFIVEWTEKWMQPLAFINDYFWLRMVLMVIGILLLSLSLGFYLSPNMGMAPYDALAYIIHEKWLTNVQYRYIRMTQDVIALIIGFVLGTTIGPNTFISSFLLGPLIQFMRTHVTDRLFSE
ncbi:putative membrane protein [Lachnospiraceae bacterium KM106-2]|nr:putative membrane protein [Lachnospiraceae bacterium KM106-2]